MRKTSEKRHWDTFWEASSELRDVYGTDGRILHNLKPFVTFADRAVLEVGAGTGRDTDVLAGSGADAYALDYSEQSLALMHRSLRHPVTVVCGDALNLPFSAESFDIVFHQGLLEHFRDPGRLIDENIRVLRRGGILLVDVPQRYHYYTLLKHILIWVGKWFAGWEREFSARELRSLLEARGLEVLRMYGHNLSPPIWYRGIRRVLLGFNVRLPMHPGAPRAVSRAWSLMRSLVPESLYINTAMIVGCVVKKR